MSERRTLYPVHAGDLCDLRVEGGWIRRFAECDGIVIGGHLFPLPLVEEALRCLGRVVIADRRQEEP